MRRIGLIIEDAPQEPPAAFVCPHCGKEFKGGSALRSHVKKTHPDVFDKEDSTHGDN